VAAVGGLMAGLVLPGVPAAVASGGATPYTTLSVAVGSDPYGVAVDETTNTIYATNAGSGSNSVSVIDGYSNTVAATVAVGTAPYAVAVNEITGNAYVANFLSDNVSVINGSNNTVATTVAVGSVPYGVAVDETTDTVYAANNGSNSVSMINGSNNTVAATIAVGSDPYGATVDENTHTIYAANEGSGTVSVIVPATVNASPTSGRLGKPITVYGQGFNPGETVKITYKTGLVSPKSVAICTATAGSDTSYTCSGAIPATARAGAKWRSQPRGQRIDLGHQGQDHLHPHLITSWSHARLAATMAYGINVHYSMQVSRNGRFAVSLPPGTYQVTGQPTSLRSIWPTREHRDPGVSSSSCA
jgi:YVTN family beta-propeller protein